VMWGHSKRHAGGLDRSAEATVALQGADGLTSARAIPLARAAVRNLPPMT